MLGVLFSLLVFPFFITYVPAGVVSFSTLFLLFPFLFGLIRSSGMGSPNDVTIVFRVFVLLILA